MDDSIRLMSTVSIIIPCYNEAGTIRLLLDSICTQTYPGDLLEVVVADGLSTDSTREVIQTYLDEHPRLKLRVVDNPRRNIPSALNTALEYAGGDVVIRLDAHCVPQPDYVRKCVDDLEQGLGDMVGGVWDIHPGADGWVGRAIAASAAHPLGVGDARYRYATTPGPVDTVPFGAYYHSLLDKIGRYDPTLLTNEDYEFNTRVRKNGGTVWLDPSIRSIYFARSKWRDLASQYWRYGFWKWKMLQRNPGTLRWRQALPPAFVLSVLFLGGLAIFWWTGRIILSLEIVLYLFVLFLAGGQAAHRRQDWSLVLGLPLGILIMHFCWGAGFLWSIIHRDS
jgi:succinoglycan biosynthesis protein ExoA